MRIEKSSGVGGKWIDKKGLKNGDLIKITSEAKWEEGTNGKQLVAKIRVKGQADEVNCAINTPSKNALIDAFGDDSAAWQNKVLTVAVETGIFAGKRGIMLNLIPEGYAIGEDTGGYIVIERNDAATAQKTAHERAYPEMTNENDAHIDDSDLPF